MKAEITVKGAGKASALLRELGERGDDPRPAFHKATEYLVVAEQRRFNALGRTKGSTQESKQRDPDSRVRANAPRAGVASGELREFMTTKARNAQPPKLTKRELVFGVPARHKLRARAVMLARKGKNPLVSRAVILRWTAQALREHLSNKRSGRRW